MDVFMLAQTFEVLGTIMIALAALSVHHKELHERKMDKTVFKMMKIEQVIGLLGVAFVIAGYLVNWMAHRA